MSVENLWFWLIAFATAICDILSINKSQYVFMYINDDNAQTFNILMRNNDEIFLELIALVS